MPEIYCCFRRGRLGAGSHVFKIGDVQPGL